MEAVRSRYDVPNPPIPNLLSRADIRAESSFHNSNPILSFFSVLSKN